MGRRRWIAGLLAALVAIGIGLAAVRTLFFIPPEVMEVPVRCTAEAPAVPVGAPLRVLVWNIQYAAGRDHHFFYDGGEAVSVPRETVEATLEQVAAVLGEADADLVLLQEVDRGSRRTAFVDQHEALLTRVPYPCDTSATYHRAPYVPHPPHEHLGKVDMHLSVFSRYRISGGLRHQLATIDESRFRKLFNLRRALLEVELPRADGGRLLLFDTHLSAFSKGDGTLARQIAEIDARLASSGAPFVLAGDFNALPPGDDPGRLELGPGTFYEVPTPIAPLLEHYQAAIPAEAWLEARWRTYLPWSAADPDRVLDYVFYEGVRVEDFRVLREAAPISDHLPIAFTLVLE